MDGSDDDAVQETWEPGLRRRRGRNSTNSEGGNDNEAMREINFETPNGNNIRDGSHQSETSRQIQSTPGPANCGIGAAGGPGRACGGGGMVGLTSIAEGTSTNFGGSTTPYKTPSKDDVGGLVAATPSSLTTAATAESTLMTQSPLSIRRRSSNSSSSQRGVAASIDLRRQYRLLRTQVILLLGSTVVGLVLFLFYALPLAAFVSLALMVSSIGALIPVATTAVRARYELELDQPLGLTRYLPDSLRVYLTETSLHEFMTDPGFYMENRYLLLYFMPGLQPDQLMDFINQLPPRHREALLQPGLGRLMPSVTRYLMRIDNNQTEPAADRDRLQLENGDDASTASGLTVDRGEHQREVGENDGADVRVNLLDAVTELPRTLAGFALDDGGDAPAAPVGAPTPEGPPVAEPPAAAHVVANNPPANDENRDDDDNSSFDFSIDLSVRGLTNMLGDDEHADETPIAPAAAAEVPANPEMRNVIVELPPPQPSDLGPSQPNDQNEETEEEIQQEYDLEGRILTDAATAMVTNYASEAGRAASAAAREVTSDAVATTSSWLVRAGTLTGFLAGGGGIVAAAVANHQGSTPPLLITLGVMSGQVTSGSSSSGSGSSNSANDTGIERQWHGHSSSQWIYGLFATSASGFVGAGIAYFVRNRVRATIAANREERLKDAQRDTDDDGGDNEATGNP